MKETIARLRLDMAWFNIVDGLPTPPSGGTLNLFLRALRYSLRSESFHATFLYRLSSATDVPGLKLLSRHFSKRLKRCYGVSITAGADIAGGFRMPHPQGITIGGGVKVDRMTTVGQNVTLGGNMGKRSDNGRLYPHIGSWTWIAAGAVVAGPISVGEDVIVGANAVVTKDVPDHAIVGGVPAKVIRMREIGSTDNVDHRNYLQYYGYPKTFREWLEK